MRLSVIKTDPGYSLDAGSYRAYMNGEEIKEAFTADEELGEVHRYKLDIKGNPIITENGLEKEIVKGRVGLVKVQTNDN